MAAFVEDVIQELAPLGNVQVLLGNQQFRSTRYRGDGRFELVGGIGQEPLLTFLQPLAFGHVSRVDHNPFHTRVVKLVAAYGFQVAPRTVRVQETIFYAGTNSGII